MMNTLFNTVRHKVSADKNRYQEGTFDLDLTYITDRIVAMAFPADGMEAAYRNNIDHVAGLLAKQHPNHFLLYNLSNRDYDVSKFGGQVTNWCGFPDHHPPPLALLFKIVQSIHDWLLQHEENVAVIHCLAGKGRTGTVIAAYFLYCGLMPDIDSGLNFFSYRRSANSWGVTGPSQLRYLGYFEDILKEQAYPHVRTMKIIQVSFEPIPHFGIGGGEKGCTPFFEIYQLSREKKMLFSSETMSEEIYSHDARSRDSVTFYTDCVVHGDIIIHFKHFTPLHSAEPMFHFGFNVGMVEGNSVITLRHEVEKAEKDPRFHNNFRVIVVMEPFTESTDYDLSSAAKNAQNELFQKRVPLHERDGTICFRGTKERKQSLVSIARDIGCPTKGSYTVKGGWLWMVDRRSLSSKRRWFVLKGSTLSYHKAPRILKAIGTIAIGDIERIRIIDDLSDYPFSFEMESGNMKVLVYASSKINLESWVKAIVYTRDLYHIKREKSVHPSLGTLDFHIGECTAVKLTNELCCSIQLEDQTFTTIISKDQRRLSIPGTPSITPKQFTLDFDDRYTFFLESMHSSLIIILSDGYIDEQTHYNQIGQYRFAMKDIIEKGELNTWIELTSDQEESVEKEDSEDDEHDSPIRLHVTLQYTNNSSNLRQNRESNELLFSSDVIPSSSVERSPVITRMRMYDKDQPFSTTCPNFVSLPSEYKWIRPNRNSIKPPNRSVSVPIEESNLSEFNLIMTNRFDSRLNEISATCFVDDYLWTGDSGGGIHVWDKKTGQQIYCLLGHSHRVIKLIYAAGRVWSSTVDEVSVWHPIKNQKIKRFKLETEEGWMLARIHTKQVNQVWAYCIDSSGTQSKINVWDAKTLESLKKFRFAKTAIGCVEQHHDLVWLGALDFVLCLNPLNFQKQLTIKVGLGMITSMVCYRHYLWITSSFTSKICVWDINLSEQLHTLSAHSGKVTDMIKIDKFLLSCGVDCNIIVWDLSSCSLIKTIPSTHAEPISQLLLASKTNVVISTSSRLLVCWNCILPSSWQSEEISCEEVLL